MPHDQLRSRTPATQATQCGLPDRRERSATRSAEIPQRAPQEDDSAGSWNLAHSNREIIKCERCCSSQRLPPSWVRQWLLPSRRTRLRYSIAISTPNQHRHMRRPITRICRVTSAARGAISHATVSSAIILTDLTSTIRTRVRSIAPRSDGSCPGTAGQDRSR